MGRRRIGKTELSQRCGDGTILYFFVGKKAESLLCRDFVAEIGEKVAYNCAKYDFQEKKFIYVDKKTYICSGFRNIEKDPDLV